MDNAHPEFERESVRWRGRVLKGKYAHWCSDWDLLPMDETCPEWPCNCYPNQTPVVEKGITGLFYGDPSIK